MEPTPADRFLEAHWSRLSNGDPLRSWITLSALRMTKLLSASYPTSPCLFHSQIYFLFLYFQTHFLPLCFLIHLRLNHQLPDSSLVLLAGTTPLWTFPSWIILSHSIILTCFSSELPPLSPPLSISLPVSLSYCFLSDLVLLDPAGRPDVAHAQLGMYTNSHITDTQTYRGIQKAFHFGTHIWNLNTHTLFIQQTYKHNHKLMGITKSLLGFCY